MSKESRRAAFEAREATRARFRSMYPKQGGWGWVIAAVASALSIKKAREDREKAKKEAELQAANARRNAEATAFQARENAIQVARQQQLASEREALAQRAQALSETNTQAANQEVTIDIGGDEAGDAVEGSKRRRQFFSDSGSSGAGVTL